MTAPFPSGRNWRGWSVSAERRRSFMLLSPPLRRGNVRVALYLLRWPVAPDFDLRLFRNDDGELEFLLLFFNQELSILGHLQEST